jgi:hypothetical protein
MHPYEILSTFQRCGNNVIENNINQRNIGSGDSLVRKKTNQFTYKSPSLSEPMTEIKEDLNNKQLVTKPVP